MKTIITLDRANQPYGYPQLDGSGSLQATGSLYGTASWALNASNVEGGSQHYVPVWTGATTLGTSSIYDDGNVVKTVSGGLDIGLKLDFANSIYQLGQLTGGNTTYLTIDDATNTVSISGSTVITGSLNVKNIQSSNDYDEVLTIDNNGTVYKKDITQIINASNLFNYYNFF